MCGGGGDGGGGEGAVVTADDGEAGGTGTTDGDAFEGAGDGPDVPHAQSTQSMSRDVKGRAGRSRVERARGRTAPRVASASS
jgi:hypothetical protein